MLDDLASVLELASSQLLHLNDHGIRVSILFYLPNQDEVFKALTAGLKSVSAGHNIRLL